MLRALELDAVAEQLGLEPNPSLHEIDEASDEPWRSIWLDHREAITTVATEISAMSETNRELLTAGYHAAQATLLSLSDGAGTYGADGAMATPTAAARRASLLDRSI